MRYHVSIAAFVFSILTLVFFSHTAVAGVKIDAGLQQAIEKDETTGYIMYFKARPSLTKASSMEWKARGEFVANSLKDAATISQAGVKTYLEGRDVRHRSFWIGNMIVVEASDLATFSGLKAFPEIDRIGKIPDIILYEPVEISTDPTVSEGVEVNLSHIKADQVWETLGVTGSGIVVANIDTGVRYTHDALVSGYRGSSSGTYDHNYNWWDPYGEYTEPTDPNGHGTHTMGIMVGNDGSNRIGVAPGAQWVACRGCSTNACTTTALLECAQWVIAPWDLSKSVTDTSKRPHVVNNSWGNCGRTYDPWFQDAVDAWLAAGIYPVFSNGNAPNCGYDTPPGCYTVGNPARYGNVTGVGATGKNNGQYESYSNWGPTDRADGVNPDGYQYVKPQVLAPGTGIRSSYYSGDSAYATMSGTSMAAPHVAGLVALMYSACSDFTRVYADVETIMERTAVSIPYASGCGGEGTDNVPNNATGWGEIDAFAAVREVLSRCGDSGSVTGNILSAKTKKAIEGATLTVGGRTVATDGNGTYTATFVVLGQQTAVATADGYYDQINMVTVTKGGISTANFSLRPKSLVSLTGKVTDGSSGGWPLYAKLNASDGKATVSAVTNPLTGVYTMKLYRDTDYTIRISSTGYATAEAVVTTTGKFSPRNFTLTVGSDCSAPGYARSGDSCNALSGGLVTGLVRDANTKGVLSDFVVNSSVASATTESNGRYVLFASPGSNVITANPPGLLNYGPASRRVTVKAARTVGLDLSVPAALFEGPKGLSITMAPGSTRKMTLKLKNAGDFGASFVIFDYPVTTSTSALAQTKVSLPPSDYKAAADAEPTSAGPAPRPQRTSTSRSASAAVSTLTGYPAYAIDLLHGSAFGRFSSDSPGTWTIIGSLPGDDYYGGDFVKNDFSKLYVIKNGDSTLYTIDTTTGAATAIGKATAYNSEMWTGMTTSVDGTLYASSTDISRSTLYTINPATGAATIIGQITNGPGIIDIAIDREDNMYGLELVGDALVKIDPATGAGTPIGSIGYNANYAQGMSFEKQSGVLYLAAYNVDNEWNSRAQLRVADTSTGNTEVIGALPAGADVDCLSFATAMEASWLKESPTKATLGPKKTISIDVTFDATNLSPGTYGARLLVARGTPYGSLVIPVTMKVTAK